MQKHTIRLAVAAAAAGLALLVAGCAGNAATATGTTLSGSCATRQSTRWETRTCRAAVRRPPGPRWSSTGRTGPAARPGN